MAKIKITTTQNIDIEYDVASVGDRILAWMIDFGAMTLFYILVAAILSMAGLGRLSWLFLLVYLVPFFYHLVMEVIFHGQSLGKLALNIKVVRLDGSHPSFSNYLLRWLFRILECNLLFFYGAVAICTVAMNGKGQRIGDIVAGTAVIKTKRTASLHDTILRNNNPDYVPFFPEVRLLSDRDVRSIQEVMRTYRRQRNIDLLNMCGNRVATHMGVAPRDMHPMQFLETVIRDYNQLN